MTAGSALPRAVAALRAGRAIHVGTDPGLHAVAVETVDEALLSLIDPHRTARLLISGPRAAALSLANEREAADPGAPVLLQGPAWLNASSAQALVDAGLDGARAPLGPLRAIALDRPAEAQAMLRLLRLAGLLPAAWLLSSPVAGTAGVPVEEVLGALERVQLVSRARLPLEGVDNAQILVFRAADGAEHVALVVGAFGGQPPLVRLHSECLTGDVFGSLKCDCGPQLQEALRIIGREGGGVLLYLRQEGRGIGLGNKIRAYALQDRGFDTVEANLRLGFADDERDYDLAAAMLRELGVASVRLLTNNPAKVAGLESAGIAVAERIRHHMPVNPHNADYLEVKRTRSGHLL